VKARTFWKTVVADRSDFLDRVVDLLKQAGTDVERFPTTWGGFLDFAKKATTPGQQWGLGMVGAKELGSGRFRKPNQSIPPMNPPRSAPSKVKVSGPKAIV